MDLLGILSDSGSMKRVAASVGVSYAKSHFSELIRRVERRESITITRRGLALARLIPIEARNQKAAAAAERIRKLRVGNKLGKTTVRQLIDEGRT